MKQGYRLFAVLVLLNILWSPVNVQVAFASRAGFSPVGIGLTRWIGIALVLAVLVRIPAVRRRLKLAQPSRNDGIKCVLLGLLLTGPAHLFYYLSLTHIESLEGNVFNTTAPLWTALFAGILLREAIDRRRWSALAIGAAGAYIAAVGFNLPNLRADHALWNGVYLVATAMESAAGVFLAGLIRRSSGLAVLGVETIGMAAAMVIAALAAPSAFPLRVPPIGPGWLPLAYLILVAGVLAFGGWTTIVERTPISLMVITLGLQAPIGALFGHWFLREPVGLAAAVGGTLVCVALAVAVSEQTSRNQPASEPA